MATNMSPFEHRIARDQCGSALDNKHRKKLLSTWDSNVSILFIEQPCTGLLTWGTTKIERRARNWSIIREKERQSTYQPQLDFVSGTCEFTAFLANQIRNTKGEKGAKKKLDPRIPAYGSKFYPPTYVSEKLRKVTPNVTPDLSYLKPVTVLHPALIEELNFCPRCNATGSDLSWNGWTTSGPRDVHGISSEEQVIGVQMRCNRCKVARGKGDTDDNDEDPSYCWGTASSQFWENKEHWQVPSKSTYYYKAFG